MDISQSLTTWQKIVQRRSFTQQVIQDLLRNGKLESSTNEVLEGLITEDIQDGFDRKLLTPFFEHILIAYQEKIPEDLLELMSNDHKIPLEQLLIIADTTLQYVTKNTGWKIISTTNKRNFAVNRHAKTLHVPKKTMIGKELAGVLFHEVIVHVLRYVSNGIVLPKYRLFEEGMASSIQMYVSGNNYIEYGRNKIRDFFLLLWELKIDSQSLQQILKQLNSNNYLVNKKSDWDINFFQCLDSPKKMKSIQQKYKLYSLGVHRFGRFIKRYNSQSERTRIVGKKLTNHILDAKFDPMNCEHLNKLSDEKIIDLDKTDINFFVSSLNKI